jgi:hypothetical protein
MKRGILFIVMLSAITINAQSLKDALYSGKLKNDTGSLVKKSDDLSSKIDTSQKKKLEVERAKLGIAPGDSVVRKPNAPVTVTSNPSSSDAKTNNAGTEVKDNNKIWKEFMDSSVTIFKQEVLPNKKIKSGTYYIFIDYEIGTDGQVNIANVTVSPESSYLQDQVKERLLLTSPTLNPVLSTAGKPVKAKRRYNFNITKS